MATYTGLLAFLYEVSYDSGINQRFHENPPAVMKEYNLSSQVQDVLNEIGAAKEKSDAERTVEVQKLTPYLTAELVQKELKTFW